MSKLEADFKKLLVKQARAAGAYARRLEDRYAVGLLDVVIIPPAGLTYFIEGKRIDGNLFGPTERQFTEGMRILMAQAQARPLLVGWDKDDVMYIAPSWEKKIDKRMCWRGRGSNYYENLMEFIPHV